MLVVDIETRSRVGLRECGMYKYMEDESTDVICMAIKEDDKPAEVWLPERYGWPLNGRRVPQVSSGIVSAKLAVADVVVAHNAAFERLAFEHILSKRYGFVVPTTWRCTAAKAATFALPRDLGGACEVLGLSHQKDLMGRRVMLRMAKPNAKTGGWNESPEDLEALCRYCIRDAEAEYELNKKLANLSTVEEKIWLLDQKINDIGVSVDLDGINKLISLVEAEETRLLLEIQALTGGAVRSPRQRDASLAWLEAQGVELDILDKETVAAALLCAIPANVRRFLEIRQFLGKSSVAKLGAMRSWACQNGRVKGSMMYHAASTGRWSGRGIQPQNYPRDSWREGEVDELLIAERPYRTAMYGEVFPMASRALRGMITAPRGKLLFCADFASIEARVLAWLAGEEKILRAFREGSDPYVVAASGIFGKRYEEVSKEERFAGKTAVLACGYQGWIRALRRMAKAYGTEIPDERAAEIVSAWRQTNPAIVAFWKGLETAALLAVKTGEQQACHGILFGRYDKWLYCQIPSGRRLWYFGPGVKMVVTPCGEEKEVVSYWGVDSVTHAWAEHCAYGGLWAENVTQALARDFLASALFRLDSAGWCVILHVHDEIVAEGEDNGMTENTKKLKEFETLMAAVPRWAEGCPVEAKGWFGRRYRK